jgi:hypothetical protein
MHAFRVFVIERHCVSRLRHNTPLESERFVKCTKCGHVDHEICVLHNSYSGLIASNVSVCIELFCRSAVYMCKVSIL